MKNPSYIITFADGQRNLGHTMSLADCLDYIRSLYPRCVDNSDEPDSSGRILVWTSEKAAIDDDGASAIASLWPSRN